MSTDIRQCTFDELAGAAGFDALCAEYAAESGIAELGEANVDAALFRAQEAAGAALFIGVWQDGQLVGFGALVMTVLPHFSKLVGGLSSYFVTAAARSSGAGLRIKHLAEHLAHERGAVGMMIAAPIDSRLDTVLAHSDYLPASRVYFKAFEQ